MKGLTNYPFRKTIKRLLDNVSKQNKKIFLFFAFYTAIAAIYPFFAVIIPKVLIEELSLGSAARAEYIVLVVLGYSVVTSVFGFLRTFIKDYTYPLITRIRIDYVRDMFNKIISVDYKHMEDSTFFEKNGRAMDAANNNSNGIEGVYHKLFSTPAMIITTLVLTTFIGMLNIFILIGLIINIIMTMWISRKVHHYQYGKREELSHAQRRKDYYYRATHDFGFGKDIRIYSFKERILNNYTKEISAYVDVYRQIKNKEYKLGFLGLITLLVSNILTYGILIYKTVNGMSIADFSMYLAAITSVSLIMKTLIEDVAFIINETQYVHDFYEFMDKDLGEKGGERAAIKGDTLEIQFKNVGFKYPNTEKYIFRNLNFKISKGERLAIVGINGAGKSTLVKLMTGLFDVTEGEILINQIPIKEFDKKELFSMFSAVFQEVNVLAYTLAENIACTSHSIDEGRVLDALDKVGLSSKVKTLPKGLNQMMLKVIEETGTEFSGGESQKLAIARALYKDANMVILDEPTAALDAMAEAEIYEKFSELVKKKTAVFVSHRLASTKFCDKIALFDQEGLKEYGNHDELMKKRGSYYKMFTIQGKYYNEGGVAHE